MSDSQHELSYQNSLFQSRQHPTGSSTESRLVGTSSITFSASLEIGQPYYLSLASDASFGGGYTLNGNTPVWVDGTGSNDIPVPVQSGQDVQIMPVEDNQTLKVIMDPQSGNVTGRFTLFRVSDKVKAESIK